MKQIFDWLREQINAEIKECQDFYLAQNNDSVCKCVMQGNVNAYAKSLSLIDEAEAKWEAECCEWKRLAIGNSVWKTSCGKQKTIILNRDETYCQYCGKPIKISEVE